MRYCLFFVLAVFLASCAGSKKWEQEKIERQERILLQEADKGHVDSAGVEHLLSAYEAFAEKYPNDSVAANFLFRAADFYRYMGKPLKSISTYEKVYNNFPQSSKRAYALFLQGFIFENEVGNRTAAQLKYEEFLKRYPDHPIAKDVHLSLENLSKTPEQLMAEFAAKQHADSLQAASRK